MGLFGFGKGKREGEQEKFQREMDRQGQENLKEWLDAFDREDFHRWMDQVLARDLPPELQMAEFNLEEDGDAITFYGWDGLGDECCISEGERIYQDTEQPYIFADRAAFCHAVYRGIYEENYSKGAERRLAEAIGDYLERGRYAEKLRSIPEVWLCAEVWDAAKRIYPVEEE